MSAEQIITKLEQFVNTSFKYSRGNNGFINWALSYTDTPPPDFRTCTLCCFQLPLVAAIEVNCLNRNQAADMMDNQVESAARNISPNRWSPRPLRSRSRLFDLCGLLGNNLPTRGDIVFFSAKGIPYFAHVAVATGNRDELISFGHDAPVLINPNSPPNLLVQRISIDEVLDIIPGLTSVHFGSPSW